MRRKKYYTIFVSPKIIHVACTYHWTCKAKDPTKVADSEFEHISTVKFVFNDKVVVNIVCFQPLADLPRREMFGKKRVYILDRLQFAGILFCVDERVNVYRCDDGASSSYCSKTI